MHRHAGYVTDRGLGKAGWCPAERRVCNLGGVGAAGAPAVRITNTGIPMRTADTIRLAIVASRTVAISCVWTVIAVAVADIAPVALLMVMAKHRRDRHNCIGIDANTVAIAPMCKPARVPHCSYWRALSPPSAPLWRPTGDSANNCNVDRWCRSAPDVRVPYGHAHYHHAHAPHPSPNLYRCWYNVCRTVLGPGHRRRHNG